MANRKLVVEVIGDTKSLERAMGRSAKSVDGFAGKTQKATRGIGRSVLGLTAAFVGPASLAYAAKAAFSEMAEAQKVSAQTQAVLKSTGGAANVTADDVDKLGDSLLRLSGVDDELIKSSQNVLLTFTKVRNSAGKNNKIFNRATKAILDMSTALGTDLQSATIQVGKALNDPIKGVSALRRVGVQLDSQQEQLIKDLVKGRKAIDNLNAANVELTASQLEQAIKLEKNRAGWEEIARTLNLNVSPAQRKMLRFWEAGGHELEAQKIILQELNKEFGGSAKAAGETLPGKINILRESLLNLGGTIAEKLSPSLTKLVDKLVSWLNKSRNQERVLKAVDDAAGALGATIKLLKSGFDVLNEITGSTKNSLKLLLGVFIAYKTAKLAGMLGGIAGQVGLIGTKADKSTKQVGILKTKLGLLAGLSIPVVITLGIIQTDEYKRFRKWAEKHGGALGKLLSMNIFDVIGAGSDAIRGTGRFAPKSPGGGFGGAAPKAGRPNPAPKGGGGAGGGGFGTDTRGVTITGPVNVYGVQNVREMERALQKSAQRRSGTRRGPNAGNSFGLAGG